MTQGRLYKSARATGAMAEEAILALPERASRPGDARLRADESAAAPAQEPAAQAFGAELPDTVGTADTELPGGSSTEQSSDPLGGAVNAGAAAAAAGVGAAAAAAGVGAAAAAAGTGAPVSSAATASSPASASRPDVTDYDHIFADPSISIAEAEDDLFPWDSATPDAPAVAGSNSAPSQPARPGVGAGTAAVAASGPAAGAPLITSAAASAGPQPTRIKVEGPSGVVEGTNNPVSTYLAKAPNIRLSFSGAVAAIAVVTVGLGLVEALLSDHIGMVTAVISVATALAATWFVSDRDRHVPALALPVAWLACALLPGQLTAPPSGSVALKQVVVVLGVLGDNALRSCDARDSVTPSRSPISRRVRRSP